MVNGFGVFAIIKKLDKAKMLFIMFNDFENFIVIKGNDKEEYAKDAVTGEEGSWTERPSDRQFAEGSFGTGYLKPMQHVYRTKAAIVEFGTVLLP